MFRFLNCSLWSIIIFCKITWLSYKIVTSQIDFCLPKKINFFITDITSKLVIDHRKKEKYIVKDVHHITYNCRQYSAPPLPALQKAFQIRKLINCQHFQRFDSIYIVHLHSQRLVLSRNTLEKLLTSVTSSKAVVESVLHDGNKRRLQRRLRFHIKISLQSSFLNQPCRLINKCDNHVNNMRCFGSRPSS